LELQLYVQAQLQFGCKKFCVSQFTQFANAVLKQFAQFRSPQFPRPVPQLPLLQAPPVVLLYHALLCTVSKSVTCGFAAVPTVLLVLSLTQDIAGLAPVALPVSVFTSFKEIAPVAGVVIFYSNVCYSTIYDSS
jgi:hypothetical protein